MHIKPGDFVTVESTVGFATTSPRRTIHSGIAYLDDEEILRVDGVNISTDSDGYFMAGVVLISVREA